jgi:hypothetical protein
MSLPIRKETCDDGDFTISNFANGMRSTINNLTNKINKLGSRIEEQEQYSRRTSLRFNNVKAPTNDRGEIRRPIDTDALVLKICNSRAVDDLLTPDNVYST